MALPANKTIKANDRFAIFQTYTRDGVGPKKRLSAVILNDQPDSPVRAVIIESIRVCDEDGKATPGKGHVSRRVIFNGAAGRVSEYRDLIMPSVDSLDNELAGAFLKKAGIEVGLVEAGHTHRYVQRDVLLKSLYDKTGANGQRLISFSTYSAADKFRSLLESSTDIMVGNIDKATPALVQAVRKEAARPAPFWEAGVGKTIASLVREAHAGGRNMSAASMADWD